MGSYNGRGPGVGNTGSSGWCFSDNGRFDTSRNPKQQQFESLDSLGKFRSAIDVWDRSGRVGPMPAPAEFGPKLGELRATEIWWGPT